MLHPRLGGGDHQPEAAAELYLREAHRPVAGVHPRVSGAGQVHEPGPGAGVRPDRQDPGAPAQAGLRGPGRGHCQHAR